MLLESFVPTYVPCLCSYVSGCVCLRIYACVCLDAYRCILCIDSQECGFIPRQCLSNSV